MVFLISVTYLSSENVMLYFHSGLYQGWSPSYSPAPATLSVCLSHTIYPHMLEHNTTAVEVFDSGECLIRIMSLPYTSRFSFILLVKKLCGRQVRGWTSGICLWMTAWQDAVIVDDNAYSVCCSNWKSQGLVHLSKIPIVLHNLY